MLRPSHLYAPEQSSESIEKVKALARSELFDIERHVRYYGKLSSKYQSIHSWIQLGVFTLLLSIPTLIFLGMPPAVLAIVGSAVSAMAAWGHMGGYANKAAVLHGVSTECDRMKAEQMDLCQ